MIMTDLEFATCNLEKLNEISSLSPKKFYELTYGDPIYCVQIDIRPALGIVLPLRKLTKCKMTFRQMTLEEPHNPKGRKARIYVTDRHGFIADKNVSSYIRYKRIYHDEIFVQVYGTTLEECIFKAEKASGVLNLEEKLKWIEPLYNV